MNLSDNTASGYNFSGLLRDPSWRPYRLEQTAPHSVRVREIDGVKCAALVAYRKNDHNDWAVSETALRFVAAAVSEGRLREAFLVLVDAKWLYVIHGSLTELLDRIGDTPPNDGPFGPYFWLNASLQLVSTAAPSNDLPF